ncbi:hypothetical protein M758_10G089900 [Ceratodon purpureus]|nr:hypothetical protein M758_10G089900 [Ceratodon purpureus]
MYKKRSGVHLRRMKKEKLNRKKCKKIRQVQCRKKCKQNVAQPLRSYSVVMVTNMPNQLTLPIQSGETFCKTIPSVYTKNKKSKYPSRGSRLEPLLPFPSTTLICTTHNTSSSHRVLNPLPAPNDTPMGTYRRTSHE